MSAHFSRRRFVAGVGLATAGLCSGGARAVAASSDDLDAFIRARMEFAHVPGLSLAIVRDGKLVRATGFGYADLAQQRPMRANTLINIASVTKTATCTAVMQLWEQKKFALDDDVNAFLQFVLRNPAHPQLPVTFRQLLTHTSSIADGPAYGQSYACGDSRAPLGQWLRDYLTADGALHDGQRNFHRWAPGARFQYSNVAYGLLGHLVERLSAMSYPDYMREKVFAPLGMSRSRFSLSGMDPESHATAYTFVKDGDSAAVKVRDPAWAPPTDGGGGVQVPHCLYSFATPPDGLARTSAEELSRLLQAYMNGGALDGQRLLNPETVAQIISDQHVQFAVPKGQSANFRQGLAWRRFDDPVVGTVWGHTGGDPGVSTLMTFRPEDRRGVVILTNGSGGASITTEIARRVFVHL
jgi:CubicO group peptidase (beta-lactamase class C family)